MAKTQDIIISNFQKGIAESPFVGFGKMQNLEIYQSPGSVKMKYRNTLSFTPNGLPVAIVGDVYGNFYVGTNTGYVYKVVGLTNPIVTTLISAGQIVYDLKVWQNYLWIATDSAISLYGPLGNAGATVFTAIYGGLNSGYNKPLFPVGAQSSNSNTMYFGNGNYVGTITNFVAGTSYVTGPGTIAVTAGLGLVTGTGTSFLTSFTPGSFIIANGETRTVSTVVNNTSMYTDNWLNNFSGAYTYSTGGAGVAPTATLNATAIPLQLGEACRCLSELGRNLLIGTQSGATFNSLGASVANVYPYDLGTLTLGFPMQFEENGINQMFSVNNICYINAGIYGNIYQTNGSSIGLYRRLPFIRAFNETLFPYPNAINYSNNELLVGTSTGTLSAPSDMVQGIYSLKGSSSPVLNLRTISTTNVGKNQLLRIGAIYPYNQDVILVGWQDGSTFGVDYIDGSTFTNFSAFFESPIFVVGEPLDNTTFDDIEVYLTKTLVAGQQIQLYWRDGFGSWTPIPAKNGNTYLDVTCGPIGTTSYFTKSLIDNANTVQIRCELSQPTTLQNGNIGVQQIRIRRRD